MKGLYSKFPIYKHYYFAISYYLAAGNVLFSLNGTTYQNNSLVTLEDIGEMYNTSLLCRTNFTACCRPRNGSSLGNWFFPNNTRFPGSSTAFDLYRTRGQMVVHMNRRKGGEDGIYRCEILDSLNVTQIMNIGVYNTNTGKV